MIKPRTPPKKTTEYQYATFDLENVSETGELLEMGLYYSDNCRIYTTFREWGDFLNFIYTLAENNKSLRNIWAHNGANYDWLFLAQYIISNKVDIDLKILLSGSQAISMSIKFPDHDFRINLLDTLRLLPVSLDRLSKDFDVEVKKIELDVLPEVLYRDNKPLFDQYLRNDVVSLYKILERYLEIVNTEILPETPINKPSPTIAAQAMTIFKLRFLDRKILTTWNERVRTYEKMSYRGGLVFAPNAGVYYDTTGIDVNSMYPWAMTVQEVPVSSRAALVTKYYPNKLGIYKVYFSLPDNGLKYIFNEDGKQSSSGIAYLTSVDLQLIIDTGGTFQVIDGYVYLHTAPLLKDYASSLYKIKIAAQKSGKTGLVKIAKLLLNSLYGKFGQGDYVYSYSKLTYDQHLSLLRQKSMIGGKLKHKNSVHRIEGTNIYFIEEYKPSDNTFFAIAAMITARARYNLVTSIIQNIDRFILADTDSMVVMGDPTGITIGDGLGEWKVEFEDCWTALVGRKMYAVSDNENNIIKIRAKGIRIKKGNEKQVLQDMVNMVMGNYEGKTYDYVSPPTVRDVINKGMAAGLWLHIQRTMNITADNYSMAEKE